MILTLMKISKSKLIKKTNHLNIQFKRQLMNMVFIPSLFIQRKKEIMLWMLT